MKNVWLRVEFAAIFVIAPIMMAVFLPPTWLFPILFGVTAVGFVLLHFTIGFVWRSLSERADEVDLILCALFIAATAVTCFVVMWLFQRDMMFVLVRERPIVLVFIIVLYPVLSALPQELVYRVLYFERYADILPKDIKSNLMLNASLFGLAHLMYWHAIPILMTFFGGLVFAYSYKMKLNFLEAWFLHSVAGIILFVFGMGAYFYSGNVVRPF
jgi:hypothetical protein